MIALPIAWTLTLLGALIAGASIVGLMVARPSLEPAAFTLSAASAAVSGWALFSLGLAYESFPRLLAAAALGVAMAIGGYWLAASSLPMLQRQRPVRPIPAPSGDDPGPAYVLLSRAEPERYSASWTAAFVNAVSEPEESLIPVALQPFLFAAQKARYRAVSGKSPARETVRGLAQRLTRALNVTEVRVAFCEPRTSLADTVAAAVSAGHRCVIVAPLAVAEGRAEDGARSVLQEALPAGSSVDVRYAEALWSSEAVAELVAKRCATFVEGDPSAGLALVMEGQPPAWSEEHPDFDEQEARFVARVATLVVEGGVSAERTRTASADWHDPDVLETVRHLAALGCTRVGVVPAVFPTESLATMIDLPRAAQMARTDETDIDILPPWGNEGVVAEVLAARMRGAAEGVADEE